MSARLGGASLVSVVESPDLRNRYDAPCSGFSTALGQGASLAKARCGRDRWVGSAK
jgi:hypothetical protein